MSPSEISRSFEAQLQSDGVRKQIDARVASRQADERTMARAASGERERCGVGVVEDSPAIGMAERAFIECTRFSRTWSARRVNETVTARGVTRQYVYPAHAPILFVYTHAGRVTAIQR